MSYKLRAAFICTGIELFCIAAADAHGTAVFAAAAIILYAMGYDEIK